MSVAKRDIFIGLMSGTSADAIDAVAVRFTPELKILGTAKLDLPTSVRERIFKLGKPHFDEINNAGSLDIELGQLFAQTVLLLLQEHHIPREQIIAIGSHGQTIRHQPDRSENNRPFTWQIADPNTIAELTRITTVADFRRRDMAAGGQGAPLVPAFHQSIFARTDRSAAVVNVGGIANITYLAKEGSVIGFDTGPGNCLLDEWIEQHKGLRFDRSGDWGSTGQVHLPLLDRLLTEPYFHKPSPKSTGRERFNLGWLEQHLLNFTLRPEDVQATLVELTAQSILNSINPDWEIQHLYICGGGAFNSLLMTRLQTLAKHMRVETTEALGVLPDLVEAIAFAWMAKQTLDGKPANLPEVTGAQGSRILGGIYYS